MSMYKRQTDLELIDLANEVVFDLRNNAPDLAELVDALRERMAELAADYAKREEEWEETTCKYDDLGDVVREMSAAVRDYVLTANPIIDDIHKLLP